MNVFFVKIINKKILACNCPCLAPFLFFSILVYCYNLGVKVHNKCSVLHWEACQEAKVDPVQIQVEGCAQPAGVAPRGCHNYLSLPLASPNGPLSTTCYWAVTICCWFCLTLSRPRTWLLTPGCLVRFDVGSRLTRTPSSFISPLKWRK